jgi:uncharacterized protein (TIGR03435 family)
MRYVRILSLGMSIWCGVTQSILVSAQTQRETRFEVAVVRLWDKTSHVTQRVTDTRLDFTNVTLRFGLQFAYGVPDYRLVGPDWLDQVRVDILATIPAGASRQLVPEMLRQLLAERFGVVTHRESRVMSGFELVRDKKPITMREVAPLNEFDKVFANDPNSASAPVFGDTVMETVNGPVRRLVGGAGVTNITNRTMYSMMSGVKRPGEMIQILDAARMTMAELATLLTTTTGLPVVDRTSLTGAYQFRIELPLYAKALAVERAGGLVSTDPPSVTAFSAVQSLGLKLESQRLPVDTVVVDKIERVPKEP